MIEKIAKHYGPKLARNLDAQKEILVTQGANGALNSIILSLVNQGDEMVLFEPTFPMYLDHLKISQGTLKTVALQVNSHGLWVFDPE